MDKDDLIKKLDRAAETLLTEAFPDKQIIGEPAIVDTGKGLDKIKAFDAVRGWMSERSKLVPEDRKSGKGEQLRDKFNRTKTPSRRNRPAEAEHSELETGADGGAGPVPNGSDTVRPEY